MAKSEKQLQAEVLGYLDSIGERRELFQKATAGLKGIEYYLLLSATNFILKVQENLEKQGKVDTGGLLKNLEQTAVVKNGTELSMQIGYPAGSEAAKYFDFVNKGVKGVKSGKPDSPYSFKNAYPSKKMVLNIAMWLRRNASIGRREQPSTILTKGQKKRKKLSKMVDESKRFKSLAYAVSKSIKMKGIKKSGFFDKAIKSSFGKEFQNTITVIVGAEIAINIKAIQPNGNNNK